MLDGLKYKELNNINPDSDELITFHRNILMSKKLIKNVFKEFYDTSYQLSKYYSLLAREEQGLKIELGSGSSLFKYYYNDVISTDIKKHQYNDMQLDAQNMDNIKDESVDVFFAINCFHHFPEPMKFFNELTRTLKNGGTCIIIDPYYGLLGNFLYKRMFKTESFDKTQEDWNYTVNGPMVGANQALSYIVFKRDVEKFRQENPSLEIVHAEKLNNYARYLLSGGINFHQLVPNIFEYPLMLLEMLLKPLNSLFALHHVIVLRKKEIKCQ